MDDHPIILLGAANIGMEAIHKFIDNWMPVFTALVSLGQVAVAIVTVIYIINKIRAMKRKTK